MLRLVIEHKHAFLRVDQLTVGVVASTPEEERLAAALVPAIARCLLTPDRDCRCVRSGNCCSGERPASHPVPQRVQGLAATAQA